MASSVRAFVLNDYGKAALAYAEATANPDVRNQAMRAFRDAGLLSARFLEPHVNLYLANRLPAQQTRDARDEADVQLSEITRLDPRWERGLLLDATALGERSAEAWRDRRTAEAEEYLERAKERIAEVLGIAWVTKPDCRGEGDIEARLVREARAVGRALAHADEEWRTMLSVTQLNAMFTWCGMLKNYAERSPFAALGAAGLAQKIARLYPEHKELIRAQGTAVPALLGWSVPEDPELEHLRDAVIARVLRDCTMEAKVTEIQSPADAMSIRSARRTVKSGTRPNASAEEIDAAKKAVRTVYKTRLRHALDGLLVDPASTMRFAMSLIEEYDDVLDACGILRVVDRTAEDTASPATLVALSAIIMSREPEWAEPEGTRGVRLATKLLARAARLDAGSKPPEHAQPYYGRKLHAALARLDARAGRGLNGHRDHWRTETVRSLLSEKVPPTAMTVLDKWLSAATSAPARVDRATAADIRSARKLLTV